MNCSAENTCSIGPSADGDKWRWSSEYDRDIYAHVFDQNGPSGSNEIPYRYSTTISDWMKSGSEYYKYPSLIPRCTTTSTENTRKSLYSGTIIPSTNKACVANTHNAGNWYSYPAATAGSDTHLATASNKINAPNSICPKGWQLPLDEGSKSYYNLIYATYNITSASSYPTDINLLNNSAMAFIRSGFYNYSLGSLTNRGYGGNYWSSTAYGSMGVYYSHFAYSNFDPHHTNSKPNGLSIRCVSR